MLILLRNCAKYASMHVQIFLLMQWCRKKAEQVAPDTPPPMSHHTHRRAAPQRIPSSPSSSITPTEADLFRRLSDRDDSPIPGDTPSPTAHVRAPLGRNPPRVSRDSNPVHADDDDDDDKDDPSLAAAIHQLRIDIVNWSSGWEPENMWDRHFHSELETARSKGRHATDKFFKDWEHHAKEGREILRILKFAAKF